MSINYRQKGKVRFSMKEYNKILLEEVPCDMDGTAKALSASYLFNVNEEATKLSCDKVKLFHHIVAQLIYLSRRTRHVAFL